MAGQDNNHSFSEKPDGNGQHAGHWRALGWTTAALLLLLPWVAMQFTNEVNWQAGDFMVAAVLLGGLGIAFELAVRRTRNMAYRGGAALALLTAFLLVWLSLGVGIIGRDGDPANLMYFGVLLVGGVGAGIARFRARGMVGALVAMTIVQAVIALVAVVGRLGYPWSGALELLGLNGVFVMLWLASAGLFYRAAVAEAQAFRQ